MEASNEKRIVKIVLTGGPCGGKSTALQSIVQTLKDKGRKTFIVQEMPTRLYGSGIEISENGVSRYRFQEELLPRQLDEEDFVHKMALQHTYKNIVLLHDRGAMDGKAYIPPEDFDKMLIDIHHTAEEIMNRYDMVIHLTTAADGAEKYYTLENNTTRKETIEEARIVDDKTKAARRCHPNLKIIDNSTPFQEKIDRAIQEIFSFLGIQTNK